MKQCIAGMIVAITGLTGLVTAASTASAADANFGKCLKNISDPSLAHYQAPGQTGNGPLIVNGTIIRYPAAFSGGVACY